MAVLSESASWQLAAAIHADFYHSVRDLL